MGDGETESGEEASSSGSSATREPEAPGGDYVLLNIACSTGHINTNGPKVHVPHAAFQRCVLRIRSLKPSGRVERAQRTHTEEYYETYDGDLDMASLKYPLRNWEKVYNTVRPHRSRGFLIPLQFLRKHYNLKKYPGCH